MTDNRTTETATSRIIATLRERNVQFATHGNTDRVWWTTESGVTWYAQDRPNANELFVKLEAVLTPEQAIAATLGSERELIDLAHNAWSMALCAMQGMPIPAEWGDAVERGLREHGIDVDRELVGFEVID